MTVMTIFTHEYHVLEQNMTWNLKPDADALIRWYMTNYVPTK